MKYVEDEQIKAAFIRMMAKLHAGQDIVLKPFKEGLLGYDKKLQLRRIADIESRLEKCTDQQRVLSGLLSSGYIEPEIYYQEKHDLDVETAGLAKEKDQISGSLKGGLKHLEETGKLMKAVSKEASVEFDSPSCCFCSSRRPVLPSGLNREVSLLSKAGTWTCPFSFWKTRIWT